jgi:hypothetical protein
MATLSLTTNFDHQLRIAKELEAFSNEVCQGTIQAENEFTLKDTIFFGLADKNFATFRSIQALLEMGLADDAFALVRVLAECTVNAVYICFSDGDEVAKDYRDFPEFFQWVEYQDLLAASPDAVKDVSADEVEAMNKAFEAGKSRFQRGRTYDWCAANLFQRATDIDQKVDPNWSLLRMVVNSPWRKASAYVHGTANSITSRVKEEKGGIVIHRQVRPEELGSALYAANLIMFALLAFVDLRLGKHNAEKWRDLHKRWAG